MYTDNYVENEALGRLVGSVAKAKSDNFEVENIWRKVQTIKETERTNRV